MRARKEGTGKEEDSGRRITSRRPMLSSHSKTSSTPDVLSLLRLRTRGTRRPTLGAASVVPPIATTELRANGTFDFRSLDGGLLFACLGRSLPSDRRGTVGATTSSNVAVSTDFVKTAASSAPVSLLDAVVAPATLMGFGAAVGAGFELVVVARARISVNPTDEAFATSAALIASTASLTLSLPEEIWLVTSSMMASRSSFVSSASDTFCTPTFGATLVGLGDLGGLGDPGASPSIVDLGRNLLSLLASHPFFLGAGIACLPLAVSPGAAFSGTFENSSTGS